MFDGRLARVRTFGGRLARGRRVGRWVGARGLTAADRRFVRALHTSRHILARARRSAPAGLDVSTEVALADLGAAARDGLRRVRAGVPPAVVGWDFRQVMADTSRSLVRRDLESIRADLAELSAAGLDYSSAAQGGSRAPDDRPVALDDDAVDRLSQFDWSPLGAIDQVAALMSALDATTTPQAQPSAHHAERP